MSPIEYRENLAEALREETSGLLRDLESGEARSRKTRHEQHRLIRTLAAALQADVLADSAIRGQIVQPH